jgi:hypothetical protein
MSRSGRCPPPPLLTPRHCVVVDGARWLHLGVFSTAARANARIDSFRASSALLRDAKCATEPVWVSRRVSR